MPTPPTSPSLVDASQPGLHTLDAVDAFKLAAQSCHLPIKEICRLMGWSESFARRVFSTEKFYPSFEDLPRFCAIVGNPIIIQWLLAKAAFYGLNPEHQTVDCRALLLRVTDIFAEVGDVATEARTAVQDNLLQPAELRRLLSALQTVLEDGMTLVGDLRAMQHQSSSRQASQQEATRG